jgi:hypothetical protein
MRPRFRTPILSHKAFWFAWSSGKGERPGLPPGLYPLALPAQNLGQRAYHVVVVVNQV